MNFVRAPFAEMVVSRQPSNQAANLAPGHTGQQLHVSGVFIVVLEIALVLENLLPILVVVVWLPAPARGVGDRLVAAFSVTCILSALVPTPLGLASYFSGGWYGGAPTCTTYQVTSIWCNLSSLALLTYMCVNCHFAVCRLKKIKPSPQCPSSSYRSAFIPLIIPVQNDSSGAANIHPSSSQLSSASSQCVTSASSRQFGSLLSINGSRRCKERSYIQKQDNNTVASAVNHVNTKHNRSHEESEYRQSVQDSDYLPRQNNDAFLREPNLLSNGVQTAPDIISGAVISLHETHNTKRLGNEHRICLDEATDFPQHKNNVGTFQADQFIHSTKNSWSSRYQSERMQNAFLSVKQNAASRHSLNNTECINEYSAFEMNTENSPNGSATMFNSISSDPGCTYSFENAADNENGKSITDKGCFCTQAGQLRDYVSLMIVLLYICTLVISSLPVIGFGPRSTHSEKSCRSWLVPIPVSGRERTFYIAFLLFVYVCLALGCSSGVSVCLQVSNRMKRERKRKLRLYHEEENIPDIVELSVLDDMKRQYSLTCVVMAGLLTWLPIAVMLTLQKAGVQVSEATLMYSNIATSLPGLLNPLLYSLALAKYRAGYKAIVEKCCSKRRNQTSHRLMGDHTHMADDEFSTDTAMDTSTTGHTCIHGRANPNHDSNADVNTEEYDEENDDDGFPNDSDLSCRERGKQTSDLSERTPLQAILVSMPPAGAFKTVLANRAKSPWQRHQETLSSSSNDNECLLVSSSDCVDEETGL